MSLLVKLTKNQAVTSRSQSTRETKGGQTQISIGRITWSNREREGEIRQQ